MIVRGLIALSRGKSCLISLFQALKKMLPVKILTRHRTIWFLLFISFRIFFGRIGALRAVEMGFGVVIKTSYVSLFELLLPTPIGDSGSFPSTSDLFNDVSGTMYPN